MKKLGQENFLLTKRLVRKREGEGEGRRRIRPLSNQTPPSRRN